MVAKHFSNETFSLQGSFQKDKNEIKPAWLANASFL